MTTVKSNDDKERTEERKSKEAERRQTQCFMLPCQRARLRATERSARADPPLRARSPVGVPLTVLPLGLVIAKVRLQAMLPGTRILAPIL
jgi:hypothetical protein